MAGSTFPSTSDMPQKHSVSQADFVLKPYIDSSNLLGVWQLANTVIPYGFLWYLALWSVRHQSLLLAPVLVAMVLFLSRCFSLMHDCGHHTLFRHRQANQVAGFLLGIICGIPQYRWSRGHAFHHAHNGNWEKYQGPSALISTEAFSRLKPHQKWFYALLRHPLMLFPGGFFYLVVKPRVELVLGVLGFFPHALQRLSAGTDAGLLSMIRSYNCRYWYSPKQFRDLLWNNLAVLGLWIAMALSVGSGVFWSLYSPVMGCAAAIFICIFFVQHNFPNSYAHATEGWDPMAGNLHGTSSLNLPPILNWFTADIGCHEIHHLAAAIPNYRLRACRERNSHLLGDVTVLGLADIPGCFPYILWDPASSRLCSITEA
jgi:omega-6 fatty acid desaturase (delta-12 desaturase)